MSGTAVCLTALGCARNDVDAEELAARLDRAGFELVDDPAAAEVVVVNTCGFIDQAKEESIDCLLAAAELKAAGRLKAVVATGCLAERYGRDLAQALPEADAIVGFDGYADLATTLRGLLEGRPAPAAHRPRDRRRLPLTPVARPATGEPLEFGPAPAAQSTGLAGPSSVAPGAVASSAGPSSTGSASSVAESALLGLAEPSAVGLTVRSPACGPPPLRWRLDDAPTAPLKIASGCDRRCAFCAIPAIRGGLVSRPADQVLAEAGWLAGQGVKEIFLVSENTTAYGKDWGDRSALARLLPRLGAVEGVEWLRLSYLQPAELGPELIAAMAAVPQVVPYFDLPFQHAARPVLRRMRRLGEADSFLELLARVRAGVPEAGIRSNFIVGFPGETAADLQILRDFLAAGQFDAIGLFPYSDEEGTAAADLDGHLDAAEIAARLAELADVAEVVMAERARRWLDRPVEVLIEAREDDHWRGRIPQQGPDDGETWIRPGAAGQPQAVGRLVPAQVERTDGVDLVATGLNG
ncbi:MAG: 30S ribosomal protein S12 methylthiotransferase RimO [Propionibacteriaceae bacterium]|jgi:ribosomal protein S12 methylthiotransferase RimO|nr:30S ribosomal protein S12 methylthiotransferase RimO [Propionibacteriaceae bacterium]